MDIVNKEIHLNIDVLPGESVKLDIAGVKTLEETPVPGYIGKITIMYQEVKQ